MYISRFQIIHVHHDLFGSFSVTPTPINDVRYEAQREIVVLGMKKLAYLKLQVDS